MGILTEINGKGSGRAKRNSLCHNPAFRLNPANPAQSCHPLVKVRPAEAKQNDTTTSQKSLYIRLERMFQLNLRPVTRGNSSGTRFGTHVPAPEGFVERPCHTPPTKTRSK